MNATIVSIYMRPIRRNSIGIIPPNVNIEACKDENMPTFTIISDVAYDRYILEGQSARIPVPAINYARGIVQDFHRSLIYANRGNYSIPGVEAVEGSYDNVVKLEKDHPGLLKRLQANQLRWKELMVKEADKAWSKVKNPALINDIQIQIARDLKMNKEWATEFEKEIYIDCPVCYERINSKATVCKSCKTNLAELTVKKG